MCDPITFKYKTTYDLFEPLVYYGRKKIKNTYENLTSKFEGGL